MPVTAGSQRSYRPWPDWLPRRLRSGRGRHEPPLRAQRPCFELPRSGSSRSPNSVAKLAISGRSAAMSRSSPAAVAASVASSLGTGFA